MLATDIEDHPENETRFGVVARDTIPAPTGHDKTSIVVFQKADEPGSLLAILQEFAARAINLTNLHSRPTKRGLGDYCFLIDLEGHVADELVADCLRDLKSKQADVKFLGSYPAAGAHGETRRRDAEAAWRRADEWVRACAVRCRRAAELRSSGSAERRGWDLNPRRSSTPLTFLAGRRFRPDSATSPRGRWSVPRVRRSSTERWPSGRRRRS